MRDESRPTYDGAGLSILQAIWRVAAKIAVAVARNAIIILQVGRMCTAMLDARYPAQHSHVATCACACAEQGENCSEVVEILGTGWKHECSWTGTDATETISTVTHTSEK
jgi:hypothetical protein